VKDARRNPEEAAVSSPPEAGVRLGRLADADRIGQLLDDFNREFGDATPGPEKLAERIRQLFGDQEITVLLAGTGPDGLAVLRFRAAIWTEALECYLAELYVVPARRGRGLGRALMLAALATARERGADRIELGTSESDVAARALYESLGFSNREGDPTASVMYFYERDL
jgi:ribosomal protein S18 acetylase RimI-like enzyme